MEKGNEAGGAAQPAGAGQGPGAGSRTSVAEATKPGGGGTAARRKRLCPHCGSDGVGDDGMCEVCGLESDVSTAGVPTTTDLGRVPWVDNRVCATCGSEEPMNPCRVCGEFTGPMRPDRDSPRVTRTDPDGAVTEFFRSGEGRVAQSMNPDGSMTETVTDRAGNSVTRTHSPPPAQ